MTTRNKGVPTAGPLLETRINVGAVEFRAKGDDAEGLGTLEGYAALYDSLSLDLGGFRERIAPGAFARALDADAEVLALADHDHARRLGRKSAGSLRLFDDATGLRVEIDVPNTTTGRDMAEEVRSGLVKGMSFGFRALRDEWDESGDEIIRTLHEVELFEVSAVGSPAYPDTSLAKRSLDAARAEREAPGEAAARSRLRMKIRLWLSGGAEA
jgi:hypothetical protein